MTFLIKSNIRSNIEPKLTIVRPDRFLLISNTCINLENNYLNIIENDILYLKLIVSGKILFYRISLCEFGVTNACAHALFHLILQLIV